MEKDEISKYKTKNFKKELEKLDKIYSKKQDRIMILFAIIAAHIFILPNDILDKFPFLVPYTEFMKETFSMVYQISIRVTDFSQSGTLWASNMMIIVIFFILLHCYNDYKMPYCSEIEKIDNLLGMILATIVAFLFAKLIIDRVSVGNIFDTQLRGEPNPNAINNKFRLFFKAGVFYLCIFFFVSSFIIGITRIIKMTLKRIKLKFKGLNNEK